MAFFPHVGQSTGAAVLVNEEMGIMGCWQVTWGDICLGSISPIIWGVA